MGRAIVARLLQDGLRVAGLDLDGRQARRHGGGAWRRFPALPVDLTKPAEVTQASSGSTPLGRARRAREQRRHLLHVGLPRHPGRGVRPPDAGQLLLGLPLLPGRRAPDAPREGVKKIVNISSNGAYNFDVFDPPHYRASKAAMDNLTKDLARRYARERIAVNSIAPAMTETPLFGVLTQTSSTAPSPRCPTAAPCSPRRSRPGCPSSSRPAGDISSGNVLILNQGRDVR
jgi:NAD(P)-dependent dehydrogenase (short-subunit alcohol dehydrogenase family)